MGIKMDSSVVSMMIMISIFLGALGLGALLWGLKTGQFDDANRFLNGTKFDGEDELRDAIKMEQKREEMRKKKEQERNYRPPD
jgi:cbb3-type cytochrome oxidase maturation protein